MIQGSSLRRTLLNSGAAGLLALGPVAPSIAAGEQAAPVGSVTFAKDIAPILFERCGGCHHPDGPAPFSLLTYAAARQRASLIAAVTRRRLMPPWKAEPGYGEFIGQRHLSDDEIDRIEHWVSSGAPEGDPRDLPPTPTWTAGWQLGTPDLVLSLPEPYVVRPDGPDFSRTFVFRIPVGADRYVRGLEFRPGNSAVVHHANIRIDRTSRSRQLDEQDPGPGYEGLLAFSAVYPDGHFLGWTPGQVAPLLPKGLAWHLTQGTDLVVETHFAPTGKAETYNPSVGLFFTDEPPVRTPAMLRLGRQDMEIPAGERAYVSTDSFVLPVDVEIQAVQPHAHYLAREIRGTATLPDGTTKPLIYIKDWDFRWQHVYRYVAPLALPKGTTVSMRYTFDNSADNPRNPHRPPVPVHWGQQTTEEMGDLWIQMLPRTSRDLRTLSQLILPKETAEEIVGHKMMLRADPLSVTLNNDLGVMYAEIGRPQDAAAYFEVVLKRQPDSAAAHYNLATALSDAGRLPEAIEHYRHALRIAPDYALAHNNLGRALVSAGRVDEAVREFREAARVDPALADAHYNLGTIARAQGNLPDAVAEFREAVHLQPEWIQAVGSLAWLLATAPSAPSKDPVEALRLAEQAAVLTGRGDAGILDVLAAAQAAAGRAATAVTTCDEALALEPEARLAAAIRQRQALYKQGRPYVSTLKTLGRPDGS